MADLGREGEITLRLDTQRLLPATDPFGRQILMGAGAFLELLTMAAAERGHRAEWDLFPDGEPGLRLDAKPFARVRLLADAGVAPIRAIAREAWRIELATPAPMMESMRPLRIGSREIEQHRDGISITSPFLVVMERAGLFDRSKFPAPDSQATQGQLKDFDAITASTPAAPMCASTWLALRRLHRPRAAAWPHS